MRGYHEALVAAGRRRGTPGTSAGPTTGGAPSPGLLMAVGASMLVERTERGDEMFMTMASRHSQHVLDLDATELITG